jgi:hypothetical protein
MSITTSFLRGRAGRPGRARAGGLLAAVAAGLAGTVAGVSPVSASSDPHRTYEPVPSIDLPAGYCSFPVHIDWLVNREYATVSTLPDGSLVLDVTGALIASTSNVLTGRTIQVNASGPGTVVVAPDGSTTSSARGLVFLPGTNLVELGFPSNLVVTSGAWGYTQASGFGEVSDVVGTPHVLTDVCAALS